SNKYLFCYLMVVVLALPACAQKTFDEKMQSLYKGTVPLLKAEQVDSLQQEHAKVYLLDIRTLPEYQVSHIKNSDFIDYDDFSKKDVKDIPKDAQVVVYCSVGYRSERVGEKMKKLGFENVYNLYGGIFDWKYQDKTIFNQFEQPTDSVHTYNKNWSQWLLKGIKVYD
ncbi:MAG: rhodanese-like domain-containing protein, partial [Bacteroidota bacterium]